MINYRNLKQALKHGLKLTKVHRVIEFTQYPCLKSHIDLNTKLRIQAKTPFEKELYKGTEFRNKKTKGIAKKVVQKQVTFRDYKQIVEEGGCIYKKVYIFKSTLHIVYRERKNKVALSSADDTRFTIFSKPNTLAWEHHPVPSIDPSDGFLDQLIKIGIEMSDDDGTSDSF